MQLILSDRQKEFATGLVIAGFFFASFAAGELALRIVNMSKFGTIEAIEKTSLFRIDPVTGLRRPSPGITHGAISINSQGFRGPELVLPKPPGTVRIAFLGSSSTYDPYTSGNDQTWPAQLVARLREAVPQQGIDYVNAGVPGTPMARLQPMFDHHVAPTAPDLVVLYTSSLEEDSDELAKQQQLFRPYRPGTLAGNSLLWAKIEKNLQVVRAQRAANRDLGKLQFDPEVLARDFEARLTALIRHIQAQGPAVAVVTPINRLQRWQDHDAKLIAAGTDLLYMPHMSLEGLLSGREAYNDAIARAAAATGAVLVDIRGAVPGDERHFADSNHFRDPGAALVAQRAAEALLAAPPFRRQLGLPESLSQMLSGGR